LEPGLERQLPLSGVLRLQVQLLARLPLVILPYGSRALGADSTLFGNDTFGEQAEQGLLNQRGSLWQAGWSVDKTASGTVPGFRITTPFIDHLWITHASGF
jgi:hypothetical protein